MVEQKIGSPMNVQHLDNRSHSSSKTKGNCIYTCGKGCPSLNLSPVNTIEGRKNDNEVGRKEKENETCL
jgi:hypothetical protein